MKTKKENPVLLLLKWAEKDRGFLIASVICAFLGGLLAIGPYIGIYRLMDRSMHSEQRSGWWRTDLRSCCPRWRRWSESPSAQ